MFVFVLLLFAGAFLSAETYDTKIINGALAFIEDYPYMVSLQLWGNHMCGGAIIDETTILTAAHCLKIAKYFGWFVTIQAGSSELYMGEIIRVRSMISHPKYDSKTSDNDIAVLKLKNALQFSNKIKSIGLPIQRAPDRSVATAAGWGITGAGGLSSVLYAVQLPVLDQVTCRNAYPEEIITERMLCAGYLNGGRDTCQGDSGGPLVFNNTVIGVVSWGYKCAQKGRPGVFSDVSKFLEFVEKSR